MYGEAQGNLPSGSMPRRRHRGRGLRVVTFGQLGVIGRVERGLHEQLEAARRQESDDRLGGEQQPVGSGLQRAIQSYLGSRGATVHLLASSDPATQVQLLNSAVAEKPNLIFLEALDSKAVAPAIAKGKALGVTILNTDGPADPAVASGLHQVLSNNYELGQFAAENLVQGLQQEHKTTGKIGVITGTAAMLVTQDRMKGFYNVLSKHPQYKVVATEDGNWDPVLSGHEATQLLSKYGQAGLQGMYGMADYQAVPIVTAAKQAGITLGVKHNGLVITGSNCFKIGIAAIKAGSMYGTATEDPGTISLQAAKYGTALLEGKKVPLVETVQEHRVTPATLRQYDAQCTKA